MGIDRPDDDDVPPDAHSDRPANRGSAAGGGKTPAEARSREEAYLDLRGAAGIEERTEPTGRAERGARSKPAEPTENRQQAKASGNWEETAQLGRWMWEEYKRRWPPDERAPVDRSSDPPGSWHGEGGMVLRTAANAAVEQECDGVADREQKTISPKLREVESRDPYRHLVGFEDRLKGRDRIKEKIYDDIDVLRRTPHEAISLLPDAIRYTFQYTEVRYVQSVRSDIMRMKEQGFKLEKLKNSWSSDQYKGINSQWIEPDTGQRFELQFHTRISFEAKQLTHDAYKRLRTHQADPLEELVLEAFQRKLTDAVPVPPRASDISDYPERGQDAR